MRPIYRYILNEAGDSRWNIALDYIADYLGYDTKQNDKSYRKQSNVKQAFSNFQKTFFGRIENSEVGKIHMLSPLFISLARQSQWDPSKGVVEQNEDVKKLASLTKTVKQLRASEKISVDDINKCNNIDDLYKLIEPYLPKGNTNISNFNSNFGYQKVGPLTFKQSRELGQYTGKYNKYEEKFDGQLCYTESYNRSTWDSRQFSNKDRNACYAIYKPNYKEIPSEYPAINGRDEYGTSIIFFFVDPDGEITASNSRWNHKTDYMSPYFCDYAFTKEDIEQLYGGSFNEEFPPKEGSVNSAQIIEELQKRLDNGEDPENVFERVWSESEGLRAVKLSSGQLNFIDGNNQILCKTRSYDTVVNFNKGLSRVERNNFWTILNKEGVEITEFKYEIIDVMVEGFFGVRRQGKYGFVNTEGVEVIPAEYDCVYDFHEGFAKVGQKGKWGFVNTKGERIVECIYDYVESFYEGLAIVKLENGKFNYIRIDGTLLNNDAYEQAERFEDGSANVVKYGIEFTIDTEGKLYYYGDIVETFQDYVGCLEDILETGHYYRQSFVVRNTEYYVIVKLKDFLNIWGKRENKFILPNWLYSHVYELNAYYNIILIIKDGKIDFLRPTGELLKSNLIYSIENLNCLIGYDEKFNCFIFDQDGNKKTINDEFSYVDDFKNGFAKAESLHLHCATLINKQMQPIIGWFPGVSSVNRYGISKITLSPYDIMLYNVNTNTFSQVFRYTVHSGNGYYLVENKAKKYNFMNPNMEFVFDEWIDDAISMDWDEELIDKGFIGYVFKYNKWCLIDKDGRFYDEDTHEPITENKMKKKKLIYEDKRSEQAEKRCLQMIRNHFHNADWLDMIFEHEDNPMRWTYLVYMYKQFMETFYHNPEMRSSAIMRLAPLFCKFAFRFNFQNNNPDRWRLNRLRKIMVVMHNLSKEKKFDISKVDIDETTFRDLDRYFGYIIDTADRESAERQANSF